MTPDNAQPQLVTVTIDGTPVQVPKGTLLVEAAKQIKREIPVYCYHSKMGPAGLCRICLVEIEGMPKLQIACNTACADGMVVHTQSSNAAEGRRSVLEFYLKNHPLDCPICDKGGECDLQDYSMAYGQDYSRSADPKLSKPKAVDLGPTIVLDEERCVVCQRCVRFDDIIVGERQLVLKDRGVRDIIATANGVEYRHNFTGNVTELCPVGALTSKAYRFKSRPWDLRRTRTACTQCSVGCGINVDVRGGKIMRTMSAQDDDAVSDTWLCDRGRYNIGFYDDPARLTQPLYKQDGQWMQIPWDDALDLWATAVSEAVRVNPASAGVIGGGRLTNEEAYVLAQLFGSLGVKNRDWRAGRQRVASPGSDGGTFADLDRAQAIVIVGEGPAQRAPIFDLRIRKAASRGGTKLIRLASRERRYPAAIPSVEAANVAEAVRAAGSAECIALVWDGVDVALLDELRAALPKGARVLLYITGEQANARGAEAMGMLPQEGALDADGMFAAGRDGTLAVLTIMGANPALHHPDGQLVNAALDRIPFVVVSDLFMTDTAQRANLVLPARGPFEKEGTTTNLAGEVLVLAASRSLEAPEGALSDLEMLIGAAERLRVRLPSVEEVEAAVRERAAAPVEFAPSARSTRGDGAHSGDELRVVVQSDIFAGGGTGAHDERIASLRPLPQLAIGAQTAARLGASTGDYADLCPADGDEPVMRDLLIEVRDGMSPDALAVIGGLPDDPANGFGRDGRARITNVRSASSELETAGAP